MDTAPLFTAALGLSDPWQVARVAFRPNEAALGRGELDLHLDFPAGATFPCPECGAPSKAHDTTERRWRHLDFFQHPCTLTARCPRVSCDVHGVRAIPLPWTGTGRGFTALFEALAVEMCRHMPVRAASRLLTMDDTSLWGILRRHVSRAVSELDLSRVTLLGVDETSAARGHEYVSLFAEFGKNQGDTRIIFATVGKDSGVFRAFTEHLRAHHGKPERIKEVAVDMSTAFVKGITEELPKAKITFDRFHVMQLANKAVDEVRRREVQSTAVLKRTRFAWLKRPENLTPKQRELVERPELLHTDTGRAYQLKLALSDLYDTPPELASGELKRLTKRLKASDIGPMRKLGRTLKLWRKNILGSFRSRLTTGYREGMNSLVQAARSKARGYRSRENFITIIYLLGGKLNLHTQPFTTH